MKWTINREWPLLLILLVPMAYLAWIWNSLGDQVPLHWNAGGEIDRWGSKTELALFALGLPVFMYMVLLIIPAIDPKERIEAMGTKWNQIRIIILLFISGLDVLILHSAKTETLFEPTVLFLFIGLSVVLLGNYFQTIKPNYFVGIRTPWTLEDEEVWRATHRRAGQLWIVGGILIMVLSLILENHSLLTVSVILLSTILIVLPILHSYFLYREGKA